MHVWTVTLPMLRLATTLLALCPCGPSPAAPGPVLDSAALAAAGRAARDSGLAAPAFRAALGAYRRVLAAGLVKRAVLTVIDFSLPSHTRRLWVLDLAAGRVLAHEYVAHGSGSGGDVARRFSNRDGSEASSLGTFVTGATYQGRNGLSLRLEGLDRGVNDRAEERGIVVHGAGYVSEAMIHRLGRLGRSWGCPALSHRAADRLIPLLARGSVMYAYYALRGGASNTR